MIKKLSQEVINQIAAGEVIERPSSVVKELLDNAIDAGADKIDVKIKNGGISLIEVSDNGSGIVKEDLSRVFEAHATSKIQNLEDLNEILSMGFRGEALSTILSVAEVSMTSKEKISDYAYKVKGKGINISEPEKCPRDIGTTIIVENLFKEIPARLKYLRTESTEYRKVLEVLIPYFLIYPNIHFTLTHNKKQIYNLPKTTEKNIRISKILKGDFTKEMLPLFFNGEGIKISGYIAQPEYNYAKTTHQYIFINKRPIYDGGIARAISEGFTGFIPEGRRVPFLIDIEIKSSLVDVNVHPKKEEVRFMNPFRIYSAVTEATKQALKGYSSQRITSPTTTFRDKPNEINYKKQSSYNVNSGLKFSQQLLKNEEVEKHKVDLLPSSNLFTSNKDTERKESYNCFQIFKMYIIAEFEGEIWIIDQHAASERIYYEKIQKQFEEKNVDAQNLLIPLDIELSNIEIMFVQENKKVFTSFGFDFEINKNTVNISQVPSILVNTDFEKFFKDLISESETEKDIKKLQDDIISVIACHASVRGGQKLDSSEMENILIQLKECENPTSCPHGRPAIWKITKKEIDKKFQRL